MGNPTAAVSSLLSGGGSIGKRGTRCIVFPIGLSKFPERGCSSLLKNLVASAIRLSLHLRTRLGRSRTHVQCCKRNQTHSSSAERQALQIRFHFTHSQRPVPQPGAFPYHHPTKLLRRLVSVNGNNSDAFQPIFKCKIVYNLFILMVNFKKYRSLLFGFLDHFLVEGHIS
jgi:hypothetical protein